MVKCLLNDIRYLLESRARLFKTNKSLVNISLKLQMLKSEIPHFLFLKKCEKLLHKSFSFFFSTKNFSVCGFKVIKLLMS